MLILFFLEAESLPVGGGSANHWLPLATGVVCVQEACGFGYRFQRELEVAGAKGLGRCPSEPSGWPRR